MSFFSSFSTGQNVLPRWPLAEADSWYFSYGSNLSLSQMAQRCPQSVFKGKATLPGYRWQINERGVANVVQSAGCAVEGLVYLVTPRDERALDRSEGVARYFYRKHILKVALEPDARYLDMSSSQLSQLLAQQTTSDDQASPQQGARNPDEADDASRQETHRTRRVKALVYVSERYTTDGTIREEYISRMRKAVSDALKLGVSESFVNQYIVPHLGQGDILPTTPRGAAEAQDSTSPGKHQLDGDPMDEDAPAGPADQGGTVGSPKKSRCKLLHPLSPMRP